MLNNRGSTLPLVLMTIIIFLILGLTILSAMINGAKRVSIQSENYQNTHNAVTQLEIIIADMMTEIQNNPDKYKPQGLDYNMNLNDLITDFENNYPSLDIEDITSSEEEGFGTNDTPNRAYRLKVTVIDDKGKTKMISRKVFLSAYPSFLDYTAGSSKGTLELNGGVKIIGNISANNLIVSNNAKFIDGTGDDTLSSTSPYINGNIYTAGNINGFTNFNDQALQELFLDPDPNIYSPSDDFIDVDFDNTFIEKLNEAVSYGVSSYNFKKDINNEVDLQNFIFNIVNNECSEAINNYKPAEDDIHPFDGGNCQNTNYYLIEQDYNQSLFHKDADTPTLSENVIIFTDAMPDDGPVLTGVNSGRFTISNNFTIPNTSWLVVHGDLIIESKGSPISISANILVTGNVFIRGDSIDGSLEDDEIRFNSIIYSLGSTFINNTNITGNGTKKQIALHTKKNLEITRINEFAKANVTITPLEGYFYTDSDAELYGVGSLFYIKGGLFAKGSSETGGLKINAVRGNVNKDASNNLFFEFPQDKNIPSRFSIEYDEEVINNHIDSLPVVDHIRVILDDYQFE